MKNREFILKKIPLKEFIDILIEAYDDGIDFIDLMGKHDGGQDSIRIHAREEYYAPSGEDEIPESDIISEDYLSELI